MTKNFAPHRCYWKRQLDQGKMPKVQEQCKEAFEQFLEEYNNPKPPLPETETANTVRASTAYVYTSKEREEAKRRKIRQLQMQYNIKPRNKIEGAKADKTDI